jgi:hypothetical protein
MKAMFSGVVVCLCLSAPALAQETPAWRGYGGNPQHTAAAPAMAQKLKNIHWHTPVDLHPQGSTLYIHYGAPAITGSNTVVVPVKTGTSGNFVVEAHSGKTGKLLWSAPTDFVFAPHDWTPSFPTHMTAQERFYFAGAGGTVYYRDHPDLKKGKIQQIAFFGNANYKKHKSTYDQHVMIDTPITADENGNIFFGFVVTGSTPEGLSSGIARIGADGSGTWISAANASGDSSIIQVAQNCAPALSNDGSTVYVGVSDGFNGYLLGLNSTSLAMKYKVRVKDPRDNGDAVLYDDSSASPTIGPDGDVYYGVLADDFGHNGRGWMLHFSGDLATTKIPGSFGWDNTVAIVPASAVASYSGSSSYLLMSKYNNYYGFDSGNGHNEIAIIDPNAQQKDRFSSAMVMKEIMTKVGPTQFPGAPKGVVYEWCINSAVIDVQGKAVIANSEDGHTYRWDLTTGKLTGINLNPPIGEAYTPTEIGPDGTVYAINDAVLYALGK